MLQSALSVLQVFVAVVLIFLVLLHSGKDAGMSGAFGVGGGAGGSTGGSLMERNLDSWTIFFAIVFAGGLICLWPAPPGATRPALAAYKARVARELQRA